MAKFEILMPKLGESVIEATITKWLKNEGEYVNEEEAIVEIATDKVDTEIPAAKAGILIKKVAKEGDIVPVGNVIAVIETDGNAAQTEQNKAEILPKEESRPAIAEMTDETKILKKEPVIVSVSGTRFYSPLVRSIAQQENIPLKELESIPGTGKDDRLTKQDILEYIKNRKTVEKPPVTEPKAVPVSAGDQIIEMDRIRQLISGHMVKSIQTSPHVTSFMEADVTKIVTWREKYKESFQKRENQKLTFTPVFIQAIARAVRDNPQINVSVDGTKIILHPNINIGVAVALPNFNLIVPVIKNADQKSLLGIIKNVNDLANRAREGKLVPDEIAGGTISLTNLGSFGTLMGTPIINQPQAAIVAVGSIKKRPVVLETADGDTIGIRHMMFVSVTYDHRIVDGALGGQFLSRLVHYLETFDTGQTI